MTTRTIPPALEQALGFNIYRTGLLYRRELIKALADYDLTPEQWQTLVAMWTNKGPCSQVEIVQLTLRDKHTVSRMIDRMEKNGWLSRRLHPQDKRVTLIEPTAKANRSREKIISTLYKHFDPINGVLTKSEHASLLSLLKKLRAHLEDQPLEEQP